MTLSMLLMWIPGLLIVILKFCSSFKLVISLLNDTKKNLNLSLNYVGRSIILTKKRGLYLKAPMVREIVSKFK